MTHNNDIGLRLPAQEQSLAREINILSQHPTDVLSRAWLELGGWDLAFDPEISLGCTHRSRRDGTWVELGDVGQDMEAGFGTLVLSRPSRE